MAGGREGQEERRHGRRTRPAVGLVLVVAALTAGCDTRDAVGPPSGDEQWSDLRLEGYGVLDLTVAGEMLFAATDDGVFRRPVNGAAAWTPAGLAGRVVNAILPMGGDTLLAAAAIDWEADVVASLYRSTDAGASWEPFQNGFGGDDPGPVLSLARLPDGTVLAGGGAAVVARSTDGARSWAVAWGGWDMIALGTHFFRVDPTAPTTVWSGGEQGAFVPFLLRSTDSGATWEEFFLELGGDNAHYSVAVDPRSGTVYTGTEGFVLRSRDQGATWETVLSPETYPYFFALEVGGRAAARVYAVGAMNTDLPQDLVVYISDDEGATWREARHPEQRRAGVLSALLLTRADLEHLLLGTTDGVVMVTLPR
jgi:photosystem II stability/assembly factor-like uncharacterized protein